LNKHLRLLPRLRLVRTPNGNHGRCRSRTTSDWSGWPPRSCARKPAGRAAHGAGAA